MRLCGYDSFWSTGDRSTVAASHGAPRWATVGRSDCGNVIEHPCRGPMYTMTHIFFFWRFTMFNPSFSSSEEVRTRFLDHSTSPNSVQAIAIQCWVHWTVTFSVLSAARSFESEESRQAKMDSLTLADSMARVLELFSSHMFLVLVRLSYRKKLTYFGNIQHSRPTRRVGGLVHLAGVPSKGGWGWQAAGNVGSSNWATGL